MSNDSFFTVATLGFDERERAMLRDVLRLSEHRAPTYRTFSHAAAGELPHILIVNVDGKDVLTKWRAYRKSHGAKYRCSEVMLSTRRITGAKYVAHRPVAISQLFSLFDQAVADDHGYRPRPAAWRPPFVLSSQEHAAFRTAPAPVAHVRPAPKPAPVQNAVIMEPADSNAATVSVTVIREAAAEARITSLLDRTGPVMASRARILVVDESLQERVQMKAALESFAAVIDFADSTERAKRLLDRSKYHLVFIDRHVNGRSGLELCSYIREHQLQHQTPVVLLAHDANPADRAAGKAAGCNAYLIKPVRQTVLIEIISDFIKAPRAA